MSQRGVLKEINLDLPQITESDILNCRKYENFQFKLHFHEAQSEWK